MVETLEQLLERYVAEETYSFGDFQKLAANSIGRELETPLHMAALRGATDDVRLLIAGGADVNARTDIGSTPLQRAVGSADPQIVRMLLEAGADPGAVNNFGDTALSRAKSSLDHSRQIRGHEERVKHLQEIIRILTATSKGHAS